MKRLKTVAKLTGRGALIREQEQLIPVIYSIWIQQEVQVVSPGKEVGGMYRVSGDVDTGNPAVSLKIGQIYALRLEDGAELTVFPSQASIPGTRWRIAVQDAGDLKNYYAVGS